MYDRMSIRFDNLLAERPTTNHIFESAIRSPEHLLLCSIGEDIVMSVLFLAPSLAYKYGSDIYVYWYTIKVQFIHDEP